MTDKKPDAAESESAILGRASASRRAIVKVLLGAAGAYAVPLMASFPMGGLRLGVAKADALPPGLGAGNQLPPAFQGKAQGRPFAGNGFTPPASPTGANQYPF